MHTAVLGGVLVKGKKYNPISRDRGEAPLAGTAPPSSSDLIQNPAVGRKILKELSSGKSGPAKSNDKPTITGLRIPRNTRRRWRGKIVRAWLRHSQSTNDFAATTGK